MSRRTRTASLLLLAAGLSLSCDAQNLNMSKESGGLSDQAYDEAAPAPSIGAVGASDGLDTRRVANTDPSSSTSFDYSRLRDTSAISMIIRTGQAWIEVDTLESAIAAVHAVAARVGGFIANTTIQSGEGQQHAATLEIKIPSANYDQAMSGLNGIGKLRSSTTTAEDVGEEYVDVNARMENAHRLEERLVTLLANRTGKLDDVLAVERELARVREEIERYEGRLRYLRSRAAISTLTVNLTEPGPVVGEPGSNPLAKAAVQAWRNFVMLVAGLIEMSGVFVPFAVVFALVFWLWRRKRQAKVEVTA